MLQSIASLAETTTGAFLVLFVVAAMVYAIVKLAMQRLRRPYIFLTAAFIAVAICRIVYFVLVGPLLIAYLLMCRPVGKQTDS